MEKEYAQALFNLSQKPDASADELVQKLMQNLRATGREKLLPRILQELRRLDARATSFGELLEVASEQEKESAEREASAVGITTPARINSSLISGWRARQGSRTIDRTGKRALFELYQHIVSKA